MTTLPLCYLGDLQQYNKYRLTQITDLSPSGESILIFYFSFTYISLLIVSVVEVQGSI